MFVRAASDRRLLTHLQGVRGSEGAPKTPTQLDLEQVRSQASALFAQASSDGRLAAALRSRSTCKISFAEIAPVRAQSAALLAQAASDGRLAATLKEMKSSKQDSLERAREDAATSLAQAFADGRVLAALTQVKDAEAMTKPVACPAVFKLGERQARRRAAQILSQAASDGRLGTALLDATSLGSLSPQQTTVAQLRREAAAELAQAASDGRLVEALREVKVLRATNKPEVLCPAVFKLGESYTWSADSVLKMDKLPKQADLAQVSVQAAALLCRGASDGRLAAALEKMQSLSVSCRSPQQDAVTSVRAETAALLGRACSNGQLALEMQQLKASKVVAQHGVETPFVFKVGERYTWSGDAPVKIEQLAIQSKITLLRKEAAALLAQTTSDGSLALAFEKVRSSQKSAKLPQARKEAADLLAQAGPDGRLSAVPREMQIPRAAFRTQADTVSVFKLGRRYTWEADLPLSIELLPMQVDPAPYQIEVAEVRREAAALLAKASVDGRLSTALRQLQPSKPTACSTDAPLTVEKLKVSKHNDAAQIRAKVADVLARASSDGRLSLVLRQIKSSNPTPSEPPQPCTKVAATSTETSQSRRDAANLLEQACSDGRLALAVEHVVQARSISVRSEVRQRAADSLAQASSNGKLSATLCKVRSSGAGQPVAKPDLDGPPSLDLSTLRSDARKIFTNSAADGRLLAAMLEVLSGVAEASVLSPLERKATCTEVGTEASDSTRTLVVAGVAAESLPQDGLAKGDNGLSSDQLELKKIEESLEEYAQEALAPSALEDAELPDSFWRDTLAEFECTGAPAPAKTPVELPVLDDLYDDNVDWSFGASAMSTEPAALISIEEAPAAAVAPAREEATALPTCSTLRRRTASRSSSRTVLVAAQRPATSASADAAPLFSTRSSPSLVSSRAPLVSLSEASMASPSTSVGTSHLPAGAPAVALRRRHRGAAVTAHASAAFRMDAGEEPKTPCGSQTTRESSLARAYDALGAVEMHGLDNNERAAAATRPLSRTHAPRLQGRDAKLARSAMLLDLGESVPPRYQSRSTSWQAHRVGVASPLMRSKFGMSAPMLHPVHWSKGRPLLPQLSKLHGPRATYSDTRAWSVGAPTLS